MIQKMKLTALIILNFNNYENTINCIESVEKYNSATIKLIAIDNASIAPWGAINVNNFIFL